MEFEIVDSSPDNNSNEEVSSIFTEARRGNINELNRYLQENCLSIDCENCNGKTALHLAAEEGNLTALTTLIAAGADVNKSISYFNIKTSVMITSEMGHLSCLQALIKAGARLDDLDETGKPALLFAKNLACFEALIKGGASVNLRTSYGVPFLALVSNGEKLQALVKAGADVHVTDEDDKTALMYPIDIDSIKTLLSLGLNPNQQDNNGTTALMHLCAFFRYVNNSNCDHLCKVRVLLESGADVNLTDLSRRAALMMAAESGYSDIVKVLLQAKADANKQDRDGKTALMYARSEDCIKALVCLGKANPNVFDNNGLTALMNAAKSQKPDIVEALLEAKVDPNIQDRHGKTALMYAQDENCVKSLVCQGGANPNMRDHNGITALMYACGADRKFSLVDYDIQPVVLKALLQSGSDVNITDHSGRTALMIAAEAGYSDMCKMLLEAMADPNKQDNEGITALMYASRGHTDTDYWIYGTHFLAVQALLEAGAVVDINDHLGRTALMMAADVGDSGIINTLLKAKAGADKTDHSGCTALMMAAEKGNSAIVEKLLQFKADPNKQDKDGKTALMYVSNQDCFRVLLEAGADMHITDHSGRTVLMIYAENGKYGFIEQLLLFKADPNKQDRDGKTALMYARTAECIKVLISHGANVNLTDKSQCLALDYRVQVLDHLNDICPFIHVRNELQRCLLILLREGSNPVVNAKYRPCLAKLFLPDKFNYHLFYLPNITTLEGKQLIRLFVCNGLVDPTAETYFVQRALQWGQVDVLKYLIANCYLTQKDLADMRARLRETFSHDMELDETEELLMNAFRQPWPLEKLALIAVSSALGPSPGREERIPKTGLPDIIQRVLLFQEPVSRLPVSEWKDIPLWFDQ